MPPAVSGRHEGDQGDVIEAQEAKVPLVNVQTTPTAAEEEFNMIASVLSSTPYRMHGIRGLKRTRR